MGNVLVWIIWFAAAAACIGTGVLVVSMTNPFYSALSLIGNLASLAVLYLLLSAEFLAAAQVLVYAGAVMVMFLFVVAYLGGRADAPWAGGSPLLRGAAVVAAPALLVQIVVVLALGPLLPIYYKGEPVNFEDPPDDATFGKGHIADFTWKNMVDFMACTECGRCQSQCPAWNTEKPLSPKLMIMSLRDTMFAQAPYLLAAKGEHPGLGERGEQRLVREFVAQTAMNDSMKAFWIGFPGAM